jgi:hypothetical protein
MTVYGVGTGGLKTLLTDWAYILLSLFQKSITILLITCRTELPRMKALQESIGYVFSIIDLTFTDFVTAIGAKMVNPGFDLL